jgi:copper chaperone CopZ
MRLATPSSAFVGLTVAILLAGCREAVVVEVSAPATPGIAPATVPAPTPRPAPAAGPITLRLSIEGMMCQEACGGLVRRGLEKVPGVTKVEVSHERKEAVVTGEGLDAAALAAAVNALDGGRRFQATPSGN